MQLISKLIYLYQTTKLYYLKFSIRSCLIFLGLLHMKPKMLIDVEIKSCLRERSSGRDCVPMKHTGLKRNEDAMKAKAGIAYVNFKARFCSRNFLSQAADFYSIVPCVAHFYC